jgi:hypothetical protein
MRERAFLANLGVSVPAIAGVSFAVATLLEALLVTILLST